MRAIKKRSKISKTNKVAFMVGFFLAAAIYFGFWFAQWDADDITTATLYFEQAQVHRIIDGDTIDVLMPNEEIERVRFIGVDAPEMGRFGVEEGAEIGAIEARDFVARTIPVGSTVWLESIGNDRDRFDRLRRYVWTELPNVEVDNGNISQLRQSMTINGLLLHYGYAVVWP